MKKALFLLYLAFFTQLMFGQESKPISGIVTDADDGTPLIGVSVVIQGTTVGTISDIDGRFTLSVPQGKSLEFTYLSYKPYTAVIGNESFLNVTMQINAKMLNEVVAIGYGTMKKSDLTGAVGSVSGENLKIAPVSGVDKALQGRLAGVTVNANSGQPGADAAIRVRGVGTINNANPIYVVDGLITESIRFLSTSDIESLEVLKDASAQAIYGSRGANGVILITTKKGTKGKGKITYDAYIGTQNRWNALDVMKRDELASTIATFNGTKDKLDSDGLNAWVRDYKLSRTNQRHPLLQSEANPDGLDLMQIDTDWQNAVFVKDALIQNHYISFEGGDEKSSYLASATYFDQEGTLIGSSYNRLTVRLNTSFQMRKWLKIGENLSLASSESYNINGNNQHTGVLFSALAMAPWDPVRYPEGTLSYATRPSQVDLSGRYATPTLFPNVLHPYHVAYNTKPSNSHIDVVGDVYVELTPIKGLTIRGDVSMKFWNGMNRDFTPKLEVDWGGIKDNSVSASMERRVDMKYESTATYNKLFAEKHDVTLMLGATAEEMNYYKVNARGIYAEDANTDPKNWYVGKTPGGVYNNGTADAPVWVPYITGGDAVDEDRMVSYLGRLHYNFDNRYLLTASMRIDGSSRLIKGYFWDIFPSAAAAWKISEEEFFTPLSDIFSFMKIRAGWGRIGNTNSLPTNSALEPVSRGEWFVGYPVGTPNIINTGMTQEVVHPLRTWEISEQLDFGIDFGLFNNKLFTTIDVFNRKTIDMHMDIYSPGHLGYGMISFGNAAIVRNLGMELTLTHQNNINGFNYDVSGNISFIENKLTDIKNGERMIDGSGIILQDEGYPLNTIYVLEYDGVFQNQAEIDAHSWTNPETGVSQLIQGGAKPGDARYIDRNNDGQITEEDRFNAGNPFPKATYGLNASMEYKGIDMQFFFQGVAGNKVYNHIRQNFLESSGVNGILSTDARNTFLPVQDASGAWVNGLEGSNGSIPNPTASAGSADNNAMSSRFVEDASYLRLKDIQLGYTLPKHITGSIGIDRLRLYVSATNLVTFTKYKGFDPEVGNNGHDWGNYPQSRNLIFGLNLNF